MGEYGSTQYGTRVKLGTCEDFYYLRFSQRSQIVDYSFDEETLAAIRFRFPFPDEDTLEPGEYEDYDRGVPLRDFQQPAELDHHRVQFSAPGGYLVMLPCPESAEADGIMRNGYQGPARLVQQAVRGGKLVGIAACNGCGARYRLEEGYEEAAALTLRHEADKAAASGRPDYAWQLNETAARLLDGYALPIA